MNNNNDQNTKLYELSIPQENIWAVEQFNQNTNINNVYGLFIIRKKVNLDILKKAINKTIQNNDALRIRIKEVDGKPFQYIQEYEEEDFPIYYLDSDAKENIDEVINTIGLQHINIRNNKLYDFPIISTPTSVYVCMKMHHIISDAWSMGVIFVKSIHKYYTEIEENRVVDVPNSYLDFIEKNEFYKTSEKYLKDKQFWTTYVKQITYQNKFEIVKDIKSNRIVKRIDDNLHTKINEFCEKNKISESSFLLATISTYFSKIFDQEKILLGMPFLNRQKTKKEFSTMGMFVATLPINIHVKRDINFVDLCKNIISTNMSCFRHSQFPYSEIQKEYLKISGQNTGLYEIAYSYQINDLSKDLDPKFYKTVWQPNNVQNTPIIISYLNHFGEQELCYDYLTKLFDENDINNIHERMLIIMNQVLDNNNCTIENINILSNNDLEALRQFNQTGDIDLGDETIVSRFRQIAKNNKNKIALKYNNTELTYQQLDEKSNAIANNIIKLKIKKGSPIALIFDKSPEMFITMLGVMKAGCYYIPILPEEAQERAEFIIKDSETKLLITAEKYSMQINSNVIKNKVVFNDLLEDDISDPELNIKPTDLCYFIYTSGSTGTPKGVMLKHENVISFIHSMNMDKNLKFIPNDIAISLLKYSFDAAACDIYTMLLNGGKLIIAPKEFELNPIEIANLIQKEKVTRFVTVSKWVEQIQYVGHKFNIDLSSLKLIAIGGEALKTEKFKILYETYPKLKICNVYGPTEATILVTSHRITDTDVKNNYIPIGTPIPCARAIILNSHNEVLPINTKGELVIFEDSTSLHNIAQGYFKLEEKTKQSFIKFENPYTKEIVKGYKTGDTAKINSNLELDFFGRNDDYRKVNGGYLVSLIEVENRIHQILGASIGIAVVSVPIRNTNSIILFVCKKTISKNIKTTDIGAEIDENLTFYMRPKKIIEIDKFPFTSNGKIDKKNLEKQAIEYLNHKKNLILPTIPMQQKIYDIIHDIVNFDFSITDDFEDDLAIDSLNMMLIYSKLNNNKISIQDLYNYPTVQDLAHLITSELSAEEKTNNNDIKILNVSNQTNLENVLLTGTTGFVGSHILRELAENENTKKIYCIVRQQLNVSSQERFENRIRYYFDDATYKKIKEKVVVLNGDLRKKRLGIKKKNYYKIFNEITTIINAAANIKHIGKYSKFYSDNVITVKNLINTCLKFNISFAHLSTLSLNGYRNENVTQVYTENTFNINQSFNKNPYLISKFEAEEEILKNIYENNLNAKIFRIGNIMPRISDNVFQTNYDSNGFLLAINTLENLQCYTEEMENCNICLTPVDDCAKAICEILKNDYCNTIYHIENIQKIKIGTLINLLQERNIPFKKLNQQDFNKELINNYSIGVEYLKSILSTDFNKYNSLITSEILDRLNFEWHPIKKEYLETIINFGMKIRRIK